MDDFWVLFVPVKIIPVFKILETSELPTFCRSQVSLDFGSYTILPNKMPQLYDVLPFTEFVYLVMKEDRSPHTIPKARPKNTTTKNLAIPRKT